MIEPTRNCGCIEVRYNDGDQEFFSVGAYEALREQGTYGVFDAAPPIQDLKGAWRTVKNARIIIRDRDGYDYQMRARLGLDDSQRVGGDRFGGTWVYS